MLIKCDICKKGNKFHYVSQWIDGKTVTSCDDCRYGQTTKTDKTKKLLEEISTPYWLHMGLKLKPQEKAQLAYLKRRGMSWSDYAKEKALNAHNPSALPQFEEHINKYGRRNAPDAAFNKNQKTTRRFTGE